MNKNMKTNESKLKIQQKQLDIPVVMFSAWVASNENGEEIIVIAKDINEVFSKLETNGMVDYVNVSFDKVRVLH